MTEPGHEAYGLRRIDVLLSEEDQTQLAHSGKGKLPVPGRVRVQGATVDGWFSLSGSGTINNRKRSYRFDAATSVDEQPWVFPFRSLKLAAQSQDTSSLRTLLGYRVFVALGVFTPEVEPVVVYMNGELLGLYILIERVTEEFYTRRGMKPERIYQARTTRANFRDNMIGDPEYGLETDLGAFHAPEIERMVKWANSEPSEQLLHEIQALLDIENFARHFAANLFLCNLDGFGNNWFLVKERGNPRLQFTPWDWNLAYDKRLGSGEVGQLLSLNSLVLRLIQYPTIKSRFSAALANLVRNQFPPATVAALLETDASKMQSAYAADRYLAGIGHDLDQQKTVLFENYNTWVRELVENFDRLQ